MGAGLVQFTPGVLLSSQAILCRYNEESQRHAALSLSKEHNPTQYEERMRIQKAGGNVRYQRVAGAPGGATVDARETSAGGCSALCSLQRDETACGLTG